MCTECSGVEPTSNSGTPDAIEWKNQIVEPYRSEKYP